MATSPTGKQRHTKTIVAKPGEWSEWITLPRVALFRIEPDGLFRGRDKNGKEWDGYPVNTDWFGDNLTIAESTFQFRSREKQEVNVVVKWETK